MKEYNYNGVVYTEIEGYPKFALAFSSEKRKYSLYSVEDGTATDFFLDEITTSDKPLRSWTENYVVGRIGKFYYLVDHRGDCFCENRRKYAICKNVFVSMHWGKSCLSCFFFVVNESLDMIHYGNWDIYSVEGFAVVNYDNSIGLYQLIATDGELSEIIDQMDSCAECLIGFIMNLL